jgi:hypothetical protein
MTHRIFALANESLVERSIRQRARGLLNDLADQVETVVLAAKALDDTFPEVTADDPDSLKAAVVAARGHVLKIAVTLLAIEGSLGRIEAHASMMEVMEAETSK